MKGSVIIDDKKYRAMVEQMRKRSDVAGKRFDWKVQQYIKKLSRGFYADCKERIYDWLSDFCQRGKPLLTERHRNSLVLIVDEYIAIFVFLPYTHQRMAAEDLIRITRLRQRIIDDLDGMADEIIAKRKIVDEDE